MGEEWRGHTGHGAACHCAFFSFLAGGSVSAKSNSGSRDSAPVEFSSELPSTISADLYKLIQLDTVSDNAFK